MYFRGSAWLCCMIVPVPTIYCSSTPSIYTHFAKTSLLRFYIKISSSTREKNISTWHKPFNFFFENKVTYCIAYVMLKINLKLIFYHTYFSPKMLCQKSENLLYKAILLKLLSWRRFIIRLFIKKSGTRSKFTCRSSKMKFTYIYVQGGPERLTQTKNYNKKNTRRWMKNACTQLLRGFFFTKTCLPPLGCQTFPSHMPKNLKKKKKNNYSYSQSHTHLIIHSLVLQKRWHRIYTFGLLTS